MTHPTSLLLLLSLALLASCANHPGGTQPSSEPVHQAAFLGGSGASEFVLAAQGALIRYADRAGASQAQRDVVADAVAGRLVRERGSRTALASLSTASPGHAATFDGISGNVLLSIYCKGHCQDLVIRVRGPAGRHVMATLRGDYGLPVVQVAVPTYYPVSLSFELDAQRSDLRFRSELTITQWAGENWHHRPNTFIR